MVPWGKRAVGLWVCFGVSLQSSACPVCWGGSGLAGGMCGVAWPGCCRRDGSREHVLGGRAAMPWHERGMELAWTCSQGRGAAGAAAPSAAEVGAGAEVGAWGLCRWLLPPRAEGQQCQRWLQPEPVPPEVAGEQERAGFMACLVMCLWLGWDGRGCCPALPWATQQVPAPHPGADGVEDHRRTLLSKVGLPRAPARAAGTTAASTHCRAAVRLLLPTPAGRDLAASLGGAGSCLVPLEHPLPSGADPDITKSLLWC